MTERREEFDTHPEAPELGTADAFSLLGDSVRLDIIRVLWEAGRGNPVSFSELYDRVAVSDKGKFNYHRQQLIPHYVRKSEDGYRLTHAGERVARAVNAGIYTDDTEMDEFDVRGACYDCGVSNLRGEYIGGRFRVDCRDCNNRVLNVGVPPSTARGRAPPDFVDAFEVWARTQVEQAKRGVCPSCNGPMDSGLNRSPRDTYEIDIQAVFHCTVCQRRVVSSFGILALGSERLETFLRERDEPLLEQPYWSIEEAMTDRHATLVSEDPFRYQVAFYSGDDACTVEFDDDLDVVAVSTQPAPRD